jgi:predicted site-specific integrase-resolvase
MPRQINNTQYYSAIDVCKQVGISRTTLLRWLKEELLGKSVLRDRRGWRIFTETDIQMLKNEANRTGTLR